ncbi:MAG: hypothetical protein KatS3mg056_3242 [Chloroflexus sp.]|nr:MAG: hypothetical protein KatS3mg056_3242 [Chloroflexus sp.]
MGVISERQSTITFMLRRGTRHHSALAPVTPGSARLRRAPHLYRHTVPASSGLSQPYPCAQKRNLSCIGSSHPLTSPPSPRSSPAVGEERGSDSGHTP